jgi:hypothetical protein
MIAGEKLIDIKIPASKQGSSTGSITPANKLMTKFPLKSVPDSPRGGEWTTKA